MRRREVIVSLPAAALAGAAASPGGFDGQNVRAAARRLASQPYKAPANDDLPPRLAKIGYDAYRDLRFKPSRALWRDEGAPFQLQFFHRGGIFRDKVEIFEVVEGRARPIAYQPDLFTFGPQGSFGAGPSLGFAGFRIHSPINRSDHFDEVAAFLGASYFRAVARGGLYGLSARGLAIGAGDPGEEFPAFRSFWIERPAQNARSIVVHALMDSPSVTGAFRFVIAPGAATRFDVTASFFPRVDLAKAGLAPMSSMFLFGPEQPRRFDDFRPEVHDSDGLLIANGAGERIWRPLSNPTQLQSSAFKDRDPAGFGLMQRQKDLASYQDLEARYDLRPSLWAAPAAPFGEGDVRLIELATRTEAEDNIVACWRPAQPLAAGREHRFAYRLDWGQEPAPAPGLARATHWRSGLGSHGGLRRFFVDFDTPSAANDMEADITASAGHVSGVVVQPNDQTGGVRLNFELDPAGARLSDLRAALKIGGKPCSEIWTYRWIAP